jgi:hypothetical protein
MEEVKRKKEDRVLLGHIAGERCSFIGHCISVNRLELLNKINNNKKNKNN